MYKELMQAVAGKIYTAIISRAYRADRYIFFPEGRGEYLEWGIRLLPRYMRQNQSARIIVMAADDMVGQEIVRQGIKNVTFKKISNHSMDCFLRFYALKDMSGQWIVVSTKKPYDTGAERLLGVKGTTIRDIVCYDIYKLDREST